MPNWRPHVWSFISIIWEVNLDSARISNFNFLLGKLIKCVSHEFLLGTKN